MQLKTMISIGQSFIQMKPLELLELEGSHHLIINITETLQQGIITTLMTKRQEEEIYVVINCTRDSIIILRILTIIIKIMHRVCLEYASLRENNKHLKRL